VPQELRDPLPSGLGPVLRALASTTRDRHRDLIDMVEGLPDEALAWSPAPDAPAIAGLVLHIVDVEAHLARLASKGDPGWTGERGTRIEEIADRDGLIEEITGLDRDLMRALDSLGRQAPNDENELTLAAIVQDLDHVAVHVGQAQLTVSLWQATNPDSPGTYEHWR
jgi:hypothetical protein